MSLYDDATFIFSAEAAAGHTGRAHALKPVEKLKDTELITDTGFDDSGEWTTGTGWSISGGKAVADGTGSGTGADLKNTTADLSGKTVKISFEISDYEQGNVRIFFHGANSTAESSAFSGNGIHTFTHVITSGHNSSTGPRSFDSFKGKIDNFSIKEVEVRSLDYEVIRDANLTATRVKADGYIEKGRENVLLNSNDFSVAASDGGWSKNNATVTSGQSGYDGTTNAWKLSSTVSTSFNNIQQNSSNVSGITDYGDKIATFSVYLKKGNTDWARINLNQTGNAYFDLSGDGAVGKVTANIIAKIEKIGSGWFRCSITRTGGNSFTGVLVYVADSDENLLAADHSESKHIFVQNAQLEYGLVATPYIDSKEVSGEAGLLANEPRYDYLTSTDDCPGALIEPERTNLVPHSEYFTFEGRTTLTYNHGKSPEGRNNSTRISNTTENGGHRTYTSSFDVTSGTTYTASIFAKKGTLKKMSMEIMASNEAEIGFDEPIFNLDDGTIGGDSSNASMVDYGNGWYRCIVTSTPTSTPSAARIYIYLREDDDTKGYEGATSENIEIYGAQVEEGPWVSSYIPTHGSSATRENDTYRTPVDTSGVYAQDDFTVFVDYKDFKTHGTDSAGLWRFIHRNVTTKSVFQYNKSIGYTGENHHQYEYASNQADEGANKVAIVYNRDSVKVYLNGAENKVDYTVNTDMLGIARSELRYGKSKMTVNRVMVFDRPLTKDEAIALTT